MLSLLLSSWYVFHPPIYPLFQAYSLSTHITRFTLGGSDSYGGALSRYLCHLVIHISQGEAFAVRMDWLWTVYRWEYHHCGKFEIIWCMRSRTHLPSNSSNSSTPPNNNLLALSRSLNICFLLLGSSHMGVSSLPLLS